MSELNPIEQELLDRIKKKIEETIEQGDSVNWVQKDYEYLIYLIEENTGLQISLSTIKRIWRNQFNRLPHINTLNALSQLAYKIDWLMLKKQGLEKEIPVLKTKQRFKKRINKKVVAVITILVSCIALVLFIGKTNNNTVSYDENEIEFSYKKSANGIIPNTVIFTYNIDKVEADEFFLQQSWDKARRVKISKNNNKQTDIYYNPGYYKAKLIAGHNIIKEIPVHITYNDLFIGVKQNQNIVRQLSKEKWLNQNYLGVSKKSLLDANININNPFQLNYYNSKEFKISGDSFSYSSSFKMDSLGSIACPTMNLWIKGEFRLIKIHLGKIGCESNLVLICSDVVVSGKTSDLGKFGCDVYNWQDVIVKSENKNIIVYLNKEEILRCPYSKEIGRIKSITHSFKGLGYLDNIKLENKEGKIEFYDDFEK